jgi:hypothetical protein
MPSAIEKRTRDQILRDLEKLREKAPEQYAQRSARLLDELKRKDQRPRYAVT